MPGTAVKSYLIEDFDPGKVGIHRRSDGGSACLVFSSQCCTGWSVTHRAKQTKIGEATRRVMPPAIYGDISREILNYCSTR